MITRLVGYTRYSQCDPEWAVRFLVSNYIFNWAVISAIWSCPYTIANPSAAIHDH